MANNVEKAREEIEKLDREERLELLRETLKDMEDDVDDISNIDPVIMSVIIDRMKSLELKVTKGLQTSPEEGLSWSDLHGIGEGVWEEDAQEYVDKLREERTNIENCRITRDLILAKSLAKNFNQQGSEQSS